MMVALAVLAVAHPVHKVPKGGEGVKSGPIGLAVILVLCIAAYFLFKSMSKHLKKVREEFPTDRISRQPPPSRAAPRLGSAPAQASPAEAPAEPDSP